MIIPTRAWVAILWLAVAPFAGAAERLLFLDPSGQPAAAGYDRFAAQMRRQGLARMPIDRLLVPAGDLESATAALAKEKLDAAVVVTAHTEIARAVTRLRPGIPVVLATLADPRNLGFVAADGSRTANITGFTYFVPYEMKHVELLKEAAPRARTLGILADRHWIAEELSQRLVRDAPRLFGLQVKLFEFVDGAAIPALLAGDEARSMDAWFVPDSPTSRRKGQEIARRIAALKRPSIGGHRSHFRGGGMMVYDPAPVDHWERVASQVRSILGGTPAREIAFDRPGSFRLCVNARAARALGLQLPAGLLKKADEVSP